MDAKKAAQVARKLVDNAAKNPKVSTRPSAPPTPKK